MANISFRDLYETVILSLHSKLVDEGIPEFINKFRTTEAAILAKNLLTKSILKHTFVLYSYYL